MHLTKLIGYNHIEHPYSQSCINCKYNWIGNTCLKVSCRLSMPLSHKCKYFQDNDQINLDNLWIGECNTNY